MKWPEMKYKEGDKVWVRQSYRGSGKHGGWKMRWLPGLVTKTYRVTVAVTYDLSGGGQRTERVRHTDTVRLRPWDKFGASEA